MLVFEDDYVVKYLKSRQLVEVYKKVKADFEAGRTQKIQLKKRQPKSENQWQFRITGKYRGIGYFKEDGFLVVKISDHQ